MATYQTIKENSCANDHAALSANMLEKRKVLLVEDNPLVQKVHRMMLQKVGCEVDTAADGKMALQLSENTYDLILMDIGLPGMNGLEVTSQIRQREETTNATHTPIITLTAYSDEEARSNSLAAGSDEVLTKPIAFNDLCELLQRWLAKSNC